MDLINESLQTEIDRAVDGVEFHLKEMESQAATMRKRLKELNEFKKKNKSYISWPHYTPAFGVCSNTMNMFQLAAGRLNALIQTLNHLQMKKEEEKKGEPIKIAIQ